MRAVLFLLIAAPACSAEPADLDRWARQDVGGFFGSLPGLVSALGSDRPLGPLDLPLAPPLPLPVGWAPPLTPAAETPRPALLRPTERYREEVPPPMSWGRPKTDLGPNKYTMRGTAFKTGMIKPSAVRSGSFRPMEIRPTGER